MQSAFIEIFGDPVANLKGWKTLKIGQVTNYVSSGITPKGGREIYVNTGIDFIRSQNIRMNQVVYENIAHINDQIHDQMRRTWVRNGDVLLNITGASIGRVAWYKGQDNRANVNQHVCILRPKPTVITPEFLSYQISMPSYQNKILSLQSGATRQAFNYQQIKNFKVIVPDLDQQLKFSRIVQESDVTLEHQELSKCEINILFASLSKRAFMGGLIT